MRNRRLAVVAMAGALLLGGIGAAQAEKPAEKRPCPTSSKAGGGTDRGCGHATEPTTPTTTPVCPDGPITGPVNDATQAALEDVLCPVHEATTL